MSNVPIALLIPVFNNQAGLNRTFDSLRHADGCFDIVVVDDGSTPSLTAPPELGQGSRVALLRLGRNSGITKALNHGLNHVAAGGYRFVARLDAGDVVLPKRLVTQQQFLEANPDCGVVSSAVEFVDGNGTAVYRQSGPTNHLAIVRQMHINCCLIHAAAMIRTSALDDVGPYDERAHLVEDYELFLRISRRFKLANLPEVLTRCEHNAKGLSISRRREQQSYRLKEQLRYFDLLDVASYRGVLQTLVAMIVPHRFVVAYKRLGATGVS